MEWVQKRMEQASECSSKSLLSQRLSTDPVCWLKNCSHIHAREHKIQRGKSLGSLQACLECRAGFVLQSCQAGLGTPRQPEPAVPGSSQGAARRHCQGLHSPQHCCTLAKPAAWDGQEAEQGTSTLLLPSLIIMVLPILCAALCKRWWKRKSHSHNNIPWRNSVNRAEKQWATS